MFPTRPRRALSFPGSSASLGPVLCASLLPDKLVEPGESRGLLHFGSRVCFGRESALRGGVFRAVPFPVILLWGRCDTGSSGQGEKVSVSFRGEGLRRGLNPFAWNQPAPAGLVPSTVPLTGAGP
jgi:hypothetical protein